MRRRERQAFEAAREAQREAALRKAALFYGQSLLDRELIKVISANQKPVHRKRAQVSEPKVYGMDEDNAIVPDVFGSVRGARGWGVHVVDILDPEGNRTGATTAVLASLFKSNVRWLPGESITAECMAGYARAAVAYRMADGTVFDIVPGIPAPRTPTRLYYPTGEAFVYEQIEMPYETIFEGPHVAPDPNCECGIWAVDMPNLSHNQVATAEVKGVIELTGKIVEGSLGWRGQHAKIAAIYCGRAVRGGQLTRMAHSGGHLDAVHIDARPGRMATGFGIEDLPEGKYPDPHQIAELYGVPVIHDWFDEGNLTKVEA